MEGLQGHLIAAPLQTISKIIWNEGRFYCLRYLQTER